MNLILICLSFFLVNVTQAATSEEASKTSKAKIANPALETTVTHYMQAWQKQDYKSMRSYESWEGGQKLDEIGYLKTIDTDFKIHTWEITKMQPSQNPDEYQVLVLVTHNPPKQIAAFVPLGRTVRSTLNQWWRRQGDKFVHLFHIERQRLLRPMSPLPK